MNRKILASLLVIGVIASLAAGSTFALFNDTETSDGNVFEAGELDLRIDWNESYNGENVENQALTNNPGPIFNLNDVKPGDEGEATISFHLEDNPGYIWMQRNITANFENGCTEPEQEVDSSCGTPGEGLGELAGKLNYTLWYDDGDNIRQEDEQLIQIDGQTEEVCREGDTLDVSLVLDRSGSMSGDKLDAAKNGSKTLVDSLNSSDQSALVSFSSSATLDQELTSNKTEVKNAIEALSATGGTDIGTGISRAEQELINGTNARANASKVMVVLSDGQGGDPVQEANASKQNGVRIITIALGQGADEETLRQVASSDEDALVAPNSTALQGVFENVSGRICEPATESSLDNGILLDADPSTEEAEPFNSSETHYIGFKWELPREVGNEVQSDGLQFDLNFYTEQARHNDNPQNPFQ